MDQATRLSVIALQQTLVNIQNGGKPSFSIVQFKSKGLINSRDHYKNDAYGNRVRVKTTYHLTDKAKQFINVIV